MLGLGAKPQRSPMRCRGQQPGVSPTAHVEPFALKEAAGQDDKYGASLKTEGSKSPWQDPVGFIPFTPHEEGIGFITKVRESGPSKGHYRISRDLNRSLSVYC